MFKYTLWRVKETKQEEKKEEVEEEEKFSDRKEKNFSGKPEIFIQSLFQLTLYGNIAAQQSFLLPSPTPEVTTRCKHVTSCRL